MVVLPQFADQFFNAERVAETGVGATLVVDDQTSDRIAASLRDVLSGGYDTTVQRIASEADETPSLAVSFHNSKRSPEAADRMQATGIGFA